MHVKVVVTAEVCVCVGGGFMSFTGEYERSGCSGKGWFLIRVSLNRFPTI